MILKMRLNELTSNQQKTGIAVCNVGTKIANADNFNHELSHESESNGNAINSRDF